MKKRTFLALILCVCFIFTSCQIPGLDLSNPGIQPGGGNGENNGGGSNGGGNSGKPTPDINDTPLNEKPTDWESSTGLASEMLAVTVMKDKPTDITSLLDEEFDLTSAVWQSECEGIATVTGGVVTGVKCGRTAVSATAPDGSTQSFRVTVEFLTSQNSGYTFPTVEDETVYRVSSTYEADRLLDRSIAAHKSLVTIDFSGLGASYNAFEEYSANLELSSHVSIVKTCYENKPQEIYFEISYETDTASEFVPATEENSYSSLANANMIIRASLNTSQKRADDFEGFAINTDNSGTMEVYNSEELWWAIQNNLKPTFPLHNSKAELFYERAKMILREIITDDMTDYEKALVIFDYLVDGIAYDYDAAALPAEDDFHTDVCYYLEGVFERGRAVCDGKSKAFVLLLGIEGIGCVRDFGDARDGGVGHAWNYVELDGEWYLVDTTAADAAYGIQKNFGAFFCDSVEVTMYEDFLVPMYSLYGEYEYSGIWDSLVPGDDYTHADRYITEDIYGTEYDFYIETEEELSALLSALVFANVCDGCSLSFVLHDGASSNIPFDSADEVLPAMADYGVYTIDMGVYTLYIMLIKGI